MTSQRDPQIIEFLLRLHSRRPDVAEGKEPDWTEWSLTVVSDPVIFRAVADPNTGSWNGPLEPGVEIVAPVPLNDPWWTVFLHDATGVAVLSDRVGGPLAVGESHRLPPGEPGEWTDGVNFEGAIVIE